jgi:cobalt-precorrin 5A hydrolase
MSIKQKKFALYAITKHGLEIAKKLFQNLPQTDLYVSERNFAAAPKNAIKLTKPFPPKIASAWPQYSCHIYLFSLGAAIRMFKELVVDKNQDPAVICVDDQGNFAIAVLSGHVGRGNQYTKLVAQILGATPVLTTASDSIGTLAADILGREFGWELESKTHNLTKACAEIVNESRVLFIQQTGEPEFWPLDRGLPLGIEYSTSLQNVPLDDYELLLICSDQEIRESYPHYWQKAVVYRPKSLILGMGCDRNTPFEVVEKGMLIFLQKQKLSIKSVKAVASIDKKRDEPALLQLTEKYGWPFVTYTAEELDRVTGIEHPSALVKRYTGTRSVAEAASLLHSKATKLLMPKRAYSQTADGKNMTMAISRLPFLPRLKQ